MIKTDESPLFSPYTYSKYLKGKDKKSVEELLLITDGDVMKSVIDCLGNDIKTLEEIYFFAKKEREEKKEEPVSVERLLVLLNLLIKETYIRSFEELNHDELRDYILRYYKLKKIGTKQGNSHKSVKAAGVPEKYLKFEIFVKRNKALFDPIKKSDNNLINLVLDDINSLARKVHKFKRWKMTEKELDRCFILVLNDYNHWKEIVSEEEE